MGKKDVSKICNLVLICNGSDCKKGGAKDLKKCARKVVREEGARKSTMFIRTKCAGLCKQGPVVVIQPANEFVLDATRSRSRRHCANTSCEGDDRQHNRNHSQKDRRIEPRVCTL